MIGPANERITSAEDKFSLISGLFSLCFCNISLKFISVKTTFNESISCAFKFSFVNISENTIFTVSLFSFRKTIRSSTT